MDVEVLSRSGQRPPRRLAGISLAGDSLPLRLRSVTVGIVGLVAAAGLGLVGMIYQQSWPEMLGAPLPQGPAPALVHNDTIALSPSGPSGIGRERRRPIAPSAAPPATPATSVIREAPDIDQSHQAAPPAVGGAPASPSPSHPGRKEPSAPPNVATPSQPAPSAPQAGTSPSPASEAPPPVAPAPADDSPGNSAQAPGHAAGGHGPPPWAGSGRGTAAAAAADTGKPSWAGH